MKTTLFAFLTFFSFYLNFAQSPKRMVKKMGDNPVYFIDSISVNADQLQKYNPNDISLQ